MDKQVIQVTLYEGSARGLRRYDMAHYSNFVVAVPRNAISRGDAIPYLEHAGVYFLVGASPDNKPTKLIYVGQSTNVKARLKSHEISKNFWNEMYLLTSNQEAMDPSSLGWLESTFIRLLRAQPGFDLDNKNNPGLTALNSHRAIEMKNFLKVAELLLSVSGIPVGEMYGTNEIESNLSKEEKDPIFRLRGNKWKARCCLKSEGFEILKGTEAAAINQSSCPENVKLLREGLINKSLLAPSSKDGILIFVENLTVNSASLAAGMVTGYSSNGLIEWEHEATGVTLKEWLAHSEYDQLS